MDTEKPRRLSLNSTLLFLALLMVILHLGKGATATASESGSGGNDIVVIVNPANQIDSITSKDLRKLYLGKTRKFSKGGLAALATLDPLRSRFNKVVLRKSDAQIDSIWSRLQFSGRARPPTVFDDPQAVLEYVQSTRNAIGFVSRDVITSAVKPVYVFN